MPMRRNSMGVIKNMIRNWLEIKNPDSLQIDIEQLTNLQLLHIHNLPSHQKQPHKTNHSIPSGLSQACVTVTFVLFAQEADTASQANNCLHDFLESYQCVHMKIHVLPFLFTLHKLWQQYPKIPLTVHSHIL